jgi:hypothetical protein
MDLTNAVWRKARRSSENGGNCVELAAVPAEAAWRKARRGGENGGACVEVAAVPSHIAVRDSKDPHGPAIVFSRDAWRDFTCTLKADG